jgi:transposase
VIKLEEMHTIITLKNQGKSNREVQRITGFNRRTVARYWQEYQEQVKRLSCCGLRDAQEAMVTGPHYDTTSRQPVKYTPEIDQTLDEILSAESMKCQELGIKGKQRLTNVQIHQLVKDRGFDIGLTTVGNHLAVKRKLAKEAFIRQEYDLGQRLEYDFGEVKLVVGGIASTYYLAVIGSPASDFRWAGLYEDQSKDAFLDSHVRFFEMAGGVWREVVYDNMRNVVSRFIGRNERELNPDLLKMSLYYGFQVNVTNCFSPEEKGYVESAVKTIANKVFAIDYRFDTLDEARTHLARHLALLNAASQIEQEKAVLLPYRPPLEIARISVATVDKYSFIRVANNFYSVPDYLVGERLTVKLYPSDVVIYAGMNEVCRHFRRRGHLEYAVDIYHYLDTLKKKPGAVKNSVALRSQERLKAVFDRYFAKHPKDFVLLLAEYAACPIDEVARHIEIAATSNIVSFTRPTDTIADNVRQNTRRQLLALSEVLLGGVGNAIS